MSDDTTAMTAALIGLDGFEVLAAADTGGEVELLVQTTADLVGLAAAATERFAQHPDAAIITSMPGLAELTGARVLAEIGHDRDRFADARGLKAYTGSAPVTRASGKTTAVLHRRVKNQRLASVGYVWAFAALTASPGARAPLRPPQERRGPHVAAQRNLFNRLLGCLHHCLHTPPGLRRGHCLPHHVKHRPTLVPLDKIRAWDVFIASDT